MGAIVSLHKIENPQGSPTSQQLPRYNFNATLLYLKPIIDIVQNGNFITVLSVPNL